MLITMRRADVDWLRSLPFTISIPKFNAIVVHAGIIPGKRLEDQLPKDMTRMRNIVTKINAK